MSVSSGNDVHFRGSGWVVGYSEVIFR